ncbi:sulfite exporter TauE/SafE family protein [Salinimonas sediminis]|uniref:Probable membrane transporter protein n=1 Tax=Salinimonas sediminis TaxID=2303538 RepID=A0A346NL05_9ALTE|nr:sulfite exporter TauE/SafE family protein [Salinimonas sediminis]AXR06212.1 sulfite exporter TauE/SafE family protein [Salinimonas sediminis]
MLWMIVLSAMVIGLSLGVLGAGGAILTVPALIFFTPMDEKTAIAHSLVIVGIIALAGTLINSVKGQGRFCWPVFNRFALTSVPGAALGAMVGMFIAAQLQLLLLVAIMLVSAWRMLAKKPALPAHTPSLGWLLPIGFITGGITGLVGVGGGFLIVPALTLVAGLTISQASATSLALIAINCAIAVFSLVISDASVNWLPSVLLIMGGCGIAGTWAGIYMAGKLSATFLQRLFAGCLVAIASIMIIDRLWLV